MAKNDTVLLDGIIVQRVLEKYPSDQPDEVFEYLSFEQVLKDFDLSREEIESGWVDGRDDGGIDGFFTLVNGRLLLDPENFAWPRSNASIELNIITSKHHDTFKQAPINSLVASAQELFNLARDRASLLGHYSDEVVKAHSLFHLAYRRLSSQLPTLNIMFYYVSRGDADDVAENVRARANQLQAQVNALFSSCHVAFTFVGAAELLTLYRRVKSFSLELPFTESFSDRSDGYVLLARLDDYCRFVTDEGGNLRRYLFDSNVRDYLAQTRVNEDIRESLRTPSGSEFWWLNNGITILATSETIVGKQFSCRTFR